MNNLSIFMQTARHLLHTLPSLPLWTFVQGKESVPVRKFLVMAWLALLPTVAFAQDRIRMEETQRSEVTIDWHTANERGFYGNQYVRTTKIVYIGGI